ncbi:unnamed protein product [Prorocentrum cordatum]|uniref:Uncharacterized protein n=1 Tax=Prorocentrum cordatum TaxID=2364126 RepID=A0ABN9S2W4_9DINO|nr:unnamed protein product [Polarella glacialis]|mmetsp:Transcript_34260/g.90925  ORF Transcript_34260/g.90925 Transcript_34260/m.90925 type:complete len:351 (+) Transcript_34260:109-1161(+)
MVVRTALVLLFASSLYEQCLALQSSPLNDEGLGLEDDGDDIDESVDEEMLKMYARYRTGVRHIGSISIVTVETRAGDPMKLPGRNAGAGADTSVKNVGVGHPWKYYRTKNGLMLKWINETFQKDPETMAIMIDGGDMVFGGCDEQFLSRKYKEILKASGGGSNMKIVMSAETACFPIDMGWRFRENATWEMRRSAVNKQVENLPDDWVLPYTPCSDKKVAPCDANNIGYRYPNWGWVMGPVKDLLPLFEFVYNKGIRGSMDQARAQWWMLYNPDRATLDYAGSLVLSTHQMAHGRPESKAPLEIKLDERNQPFILNKITKQPCCFAHGNGNGEALIGSLARRMNNLTGAV